MRLLIDYFKGRDVGIHQEPHHRPLCARRLIDPRVVGPRADGIIYNKAHQTWAISQSSHEMRTFQIVVHKLTTTRVLNLIMKELQVSIQHAEIRNANVRTRQGYESPAHVIQTVDPGTIQRLLEAVSKDQPIMIDQTCYNIEHYTVEITRGHNPRAFGTRTRAETEAQLQNETIARSRNDRSAIGANTMPFISF
eukprot:1518482-Heterocapsa_arctica.AAC.1